MRDVTTDGGQPSGTHGNESPRRLTSVDVAREAGVSRTTVSYVLNHTPNQRISDSTREKVWQAVQRLNYAPSAAARTLRSGRSDVVVWLMPDWPTSITTAQTIDQLAAAMAHAGFTLVIHPQAGSARPAAEVWKSIAPRAVLLWEPPAAADMAAIRAAGAEVVLTMLSGTGAATEGLATGAVGWELAAQQAGRVQVEHLARRGHRRLGYAYPRDPRVQSFAVPRLAGARAACADLGLPEPSCRLVGLDPDDASDVVSRWRQEVEPVTAVCSFNDETALAILAGLRQLGLRAPTDLAVMGLDDIVSARLSDPPLTSVYTDTAVVVDYLVQALLSGLGGGALPPSPGAALIRLAVRDSA